MFRLVILTSRVRNILSWYVLFVLWLTIGNSQRELRIPSNSWISAQASLESLLQGYLPRPTLTQARPRSHKKRENGGSTPTLCFDKTVLACGTHAGKHT